MAATTITGPINNVNNEPFANKWIKFTLGQLGTDATAGVTVAQSSDSVQTDASGDFSVDIWDNGESGTTSVLEIKIEGSRPEYVIIPQGTASIEIWDLIENYQAVDSSPQVPVVSDLFLEASANLGDVADAATSRANLGLGNVDNTSDADKPISTATQTALDGKQTQSAVLDATTASFTIADQVKLDSVDAGAGPNDPNALTSDDIGVTVQAHSPALDGTTASYTTTEETKLAGIDAGAQVNNPNELETGDIGVTVQAHDAVLDNTTAAFTTAYETKLNGIDTGAEVNDPTTLLDADIGSTVQAHDPVLDATTASFTTADETKLDSVREASTTLVTTTTYTVLATDNVVLVDDDTAGSDVTINIPSASTFGDGWTFTIKKLGTTADIILTPDGVETIDLNASRTMRQQLEATSLCSDGTNWKVLYPSVYTGWAQYIDGEYTSGSPLSVNSSKVQITVNPTIGAGSKIETYLPAGVGEFWDDTNNRIQAQKEGDAYTVRLNFTGDPAGVSDFGQIIFDIGDGAPDIPIATRTVSFAKATATTVSTTTSLFSLSTFVANGCKIYFDTSDSGDNVDIYDISVVITRTHSPL